MKIITEDDVCPLAAAKYGACSWRILKTLDYRFHRHVATYRDCLARFRWSIGDMNG
jgi:hypothetical protein